MELKHIKEEKCSDCGAAIATEITNQKHTNGLWNEERHFTCGKRVHFIPNYGIDYEPRIDRECPNSKRVKAIHSKRSKLNEQITELINNSKVDGDYKQRLRDGIRFI